LRSEDIAFAGWDDRGACATGTTVLTGERDATAFLDGARRYNACRIVTNCF
jgi:hypothetical protein